MSLHSASSYTHKPSFLGSLGSNSIKDLERTTSFASSTSNSQMSGLERNFTASTSHTTSSFATTFSDHDGTITGGSNVYRGDSFGSKSYISESSIPQTMNQREPSITISDASAGRAPSEAASRSRLAAELEQTMAAIKRQEALEDAEQYDYTEEGYEDEYETDDGLDSFVNFALLSNIAVWLRDKVPRGTHVKGSIPYPRAFTGKDIVVRPTLLQYSPSCINILNSLNSPHSGRKSITSSSSIKESPQETDISLYKSLEACSNNSSSMKSNGAAVFCKMASRTFTCSLMIRREGQRPCRSGRSYRRASSLFLLGATLRAVKMVHHATHSRALAGQG